MVSRSQRHGVVLVIASLAAFMASLDVFIVNVAFDQIGADLSGATLSQLSWVLSGYAIVYAALLVPAGRIADRYGRKGGFLIGLAVFTAASAACAASDGVWWLVGSRVVQATGAALLTRQVWGWLWRPRRRYIGIARCASGPPRAPSRPHSARR